MSWGTNKQTNKQTRRGFFPPKSASDLKISYGYPPDNGLGSRLSFPLFLHNLPLSKSRYTLPNLQSFSGLELDLLRITQRNSWQGWTMNCIWEVLRVQRPGEMQGAILPLCCLHVSSVHHYVQISHLKISIHNGHRLSGKTTQVFFSVSLFPWCE